MKAYVFGAKSECLKLVPELRVGTVQINGGSPNRPDAPIVGYKHSGIGAEWGEDGINEWVEAKFVVDTDIESLGDKMIACIEAKRAALGI